MSLAGTHAALRRVWTVELQAQVNGPSLACSRCSPAGQRVQATSARSAVLGHLAGHASVERLPRHLRTCQCREQGCAWHPRHRGCSGPVLLALTSDRGGRLWRLADACRACAAATHRTAVVPAMLLRRSPRSHPGATHPSKRSAAADERVRVRHMLTYLASSLPQSTSPAARLLALQYALRADTLGRSQLPAGLLRGMCVLGRRELWAELTAAHFLSTPPFRKAPGIVQLLDTGAWSNHYGRQARRRAAGWSLSPGPLRVPSGAAAALRLVALVVASHSAGTADLEDLARLCGHSAGQAAELLDRLVAVRALAFWQHDATSGTARWRLAQCSSMSGALGTG
jgi:hypothetical protein